MIMRRSAHKDAESPAGQIVEPCRPPKYLRDIIQRMEDDEGVKATYNVSEPVPQAASAEIVYGRNHMKWRTA